MKASDFFNLPENLKMFSYFFQPDDIPWNWIANIEKALIAHGEFFAKKNINKNIFDKFFNKILKIKKGFHVGENVYIGKNVKFPVSYTIEDNVFIGDNTEIRSGALIRRNCIIGKNCVIGNSCEIKNSLLMNNVHVAHFNYIGDSILGNNSHLSAGAILSNLRFDGRKIAINLPGERIDTDLRKFGAILGEGAQVGCNSVLLPGAILGKNSIVSVATTFSGVLQDNNIIYSEQNCVKKEI